MVRDRRDKRRRKMEEKGNKSGYIQIKNARVHNLKGVDLDLPRNQMIVITGVSGSGKSSLAFDTLYAEGQRRYVESLSSYVRQFLGRMDKPEVDYIKGIPPAIAIEQKVISNNPRSTVGTTTEIYEYMKLLYARIGHTISPVSGQEVKRHTAEDVINHILSLPDGTAVYLLTPLTPAGERKPEETLKVLMSQGFSRVELDGEFLRIADIAGEKRVTEQWNAMRLVIDRVRVSRERELTNRLYDSVETAFFEGRDVCVVMHETEDGKRVRTEFSKAFEADGIRFELPNDKMFAFNNPLGACPTCEGYGRVLGIDPDLVIPDKSLSVYQDAVACWRGETMGEWKQMLIANAEKFKFPIHRPYYKLTPEQQRILQWIEDQLGVNVNAMSTYTMSIIDAIRMQSDGPVDFMHRLQSSGLFTTARARRIAVTETNSAVNQSIAQSAEETADGREMVKTWRTSGRTNVRDTHRVMADVTIPSEEFYRVPTRKGGIDLMMYPGDRAHGASPENYMNCHCKSFPRLAEYE